MHKLASAFHPLSGTTQILSITDEATPRFHFYSSIFGQVHERFVDLVEARAMLAVWTLRASEYRSEIRFWSTHRIGALFDVWGWDDQRLIDEGKAAYAAELAADQ